MQLPQTYTTVVHQCYTLVVVQKLLCACYIHPLQSDLVVLQSYKMPPASPAHQNCSFHTDRAATTHLLRPQQDWRQAGNIALNGIVTNSSRACYSTSRVTSVASNYNAHYAPRGASMTVTTIVDCWLVKIILI